jgi:hypothetical protein
MAKFSLGANFTPGGQKDEVESRPLFFSDATSFCGFDICGQKKYFRIIISQDNLVRNFIDRR